MEFDVSGLRVMIGMPILDGKKAWETEQSLLDTRAAMAKTSMHLEERYVIGCSIIEMARSKIVHQFLDSDCNRLFMIDADIVWRPEDFIRLCALSTRMDVVGGTYPAKKLPTRFMLKWDGGLSLNEYGCASIHGMGLGFTVVARSVIEGLVWSSPRLKFSGEDVRRPHFFGCGENDAGEFEGEDMKFFRSVRGKGHPVWLDTTLNLGHVGSYVYRGSVRDAMKFT